MWVESNRPINQKDGSTGWLHKLGDDAPKPKPVVEKPRPTINARKLWEQFNEETDILMLKKLALSIGVNVAALRSLCCVWIKDKRAYGFPMYDGFGNMVGIRLRSITGAKWAITGSTQGIFVPMGDSAKRALITEGPTDTAAALSLGQWAIGRPHCSGGVSDIMQLFNRNDVREAVIVSDNDGPGLRGSQMLQRHLAIPSCLLILPCKDIRNFVNRGGTIDDLNSIVKSLIWKQPTQSGH